MMPAGGMSAAAEKGISARPARQLWDDPTPIPVHAEAGHDHY
jgi:hypothetical protein